METKSIRQKWRPILQSFAEGETRRLEIPADELGAVRTMSYKIGKFSLVDDGNGYTKVTRKKPSDRSIRSQVYSELKKSPSRVEFGGLPYTHVGQYVRHWNMKNGTAYRVVEEGDKLVVWRDVGQELCQPLIDAINGTPPPKDVQSVWDVFLNMAQALESVGTEAAKIVKTAIDNIYQM